MSDKEKKPRGYWNNYEHCYNAAKECNTKTEFSKKYVRAYKIAVKNKWIDDYTWFESPQKQNGYWNKERCLEEAKKYKTKNELKKKCGSAYNVLLKNKWLDECVWFEQKTHQRYYWCDYDKCYEEALKSMTRSEFQKKSPSAYRAAKKMGWIDDYYWFEIETNPYTNGRDNVYAYFFNDLNAVYIGRTIYPKRRNTQHNKKENSTVLRFANKNNVSVPEMTILKSGLTVNEGREKEDYYVNKYKNEGWNVLNKAKTGKNCGSIGGIGKGKWNRTSCYKEAQKYRTLKDFIENSPSAYNVANKNKWTKEYVWLERTRKPSGYLSYERCLEEAIKYNSKTEFRKWNGSAFQISKLNGWLDEFFPKVAA